MSVPVLQSVAITGAITEAAKRKIGRPRPYTSPAFEAAYPEIYNSQYMIDLRNQSDTYKSFPSGHTSNAATTYFSTKLFSPSTTIQKKQIYGHMEQQPPSPF